MSVRVVEITGEPAKIHLASEHNSDQWKNGLSVKDYCEREVLLDKISDEDGAATRHWAVEVDENGTSIMVAACRLLFRPAYMRTDSGAKSVVNAVICCVFTLHEHRGKGYAAIMIDRVRELAAKEAALVSLWSDVGDYYCRVGFEFAEPETKPTSRSIEIPVSKLQVPAPASSGKIELLTGAQVLDIVVPLHNAQVKAYVERCSGNNCIAVEPTRATYRYFIERSWFTASKLGMHLPDVFGAKIEKAWVSWTYFLDLKHLEILSMDGPVESLVPLVQAAVKVASELGLQTGIYNADLANHDEKSKASDLVAALNVTGIEAAETVRTESLPMMAPPALWVFPAKYAWY